MVTLGAPNGATHSITIKPFAVRASLAVGEECGGWDGHFRASITMDCKELDKRGFVVENLSIIRATRKFFAGRKFVASCEQLCECIAHLANKLGEGRLTRIRVRVYNLTGHVDLDWKRGCSIPPLPVCLGSTKRKAKRK
jgi:hypothetical protein